MHKIVYPLTAFLLAGSLFAADPFVGTWKLNVTKSTFGGPTKPPKELTIVIQEHGDQGFDIVTSVAADGSSISYKGAFPGTGGDVKVLEGGGGFPAGTSGVLAKRKADSRSRDWTITLPSRMTLREHDVVSKDGKTMQMTTKGMDAQGKPFETVEVFDRM
jgi:hypothetical protein